jgi:hypothetical protein
MNRSKQIVQNGSCRKTGAVASRRAAVCSLGAAISAVVTGSIFGQDTEKIDNEAERQLMEKDLQRFEEVKRQSMEAARKARRERMPPEKREVAEQMANAGSIEEQQRILEDWHVRQTTIRLRQELGVSEEEWTVIQPRMAHIFYVHRASYGVGASPAALRVAQLMGELRVLVNNKETKPEEIKAKLTALRSAKVQARQELSQAQKSLRQLMTLRQEAVLVLNGLLE